MAQDYETIRDNITLSLNEIYRVYYTKSGNSNRNLQFDCALNYVRSSLEELDKLWSASREADCEQRA